MTHGVDLEAFLEAASVEEVDNNGGSPVSAGERRAYKKNRGVSRTFLDGSERFQVPILRPDYYAELLAWALQRHIEADGWKICKTIGSYEPMPNYLSLNTDHGRSEKALGRGSHLLQKDGIKVVATIDAMSPMRPVSLVVAGNRKKAVQGFADAVEKMARGPNLYGGKKLEFSSRIRFLHVPERTWDDLKLEPALKDAIEANTLGFLSRREELSRYGVPPRRGVILAGEPGTGKTLIAKVLANNSPGITFILASERYMTHGSYISDLYELATDLKPSLVFIEDIDLVGEDRAESRYGKGPGLLTLLKMLDGVEECMEVVTVATTNFLEAVDKALSRRPSRFDRVIQIPLPAMEQRKELVLALATKIPLEEDLQEHMARKTENCTPAQIQEVAYSLVIEHQHSPKCDGMGNCKYSIEELNGVLTRMNGKTREMGFRKSVDNGDGSALGAITYSGIKGFPGINEERRSS